MAEIELSRLVPLADAGRTRWNFPPPDRAGYIELHEGAGHHALALDSSSDTHLEWVSNYTIHAYPLGGRTNARSN